jgi:hypothetical protein
MVTDKENFFCSELVLAALQVMGYVSPEIECGTIMPKSFSANRSSKDISWLDGVELGPEQLIDFSI